MENTPTTPPKTAESRRKEELHPEVRREACWIHTRIIMALNSSISLKAAQIMAEYLHENNPSSTGDFDKDMEQLLQCTVSITIGDMCDDTVDEKDQIERVQLAIEYMRNEKNTMKAFGDCLHRARMLFLQMPIF